MTGSRKIELVWRCSSCGEKNLGRFKECQKCGDPKGPDEKHEMPAASSTDVPSVTDPALLAQASAGPDWRCPFCRTDNRAPMPQCVQCGSPRGARPDTAPAGARLGAAAAPVPTRARLSPFVIVFGGVMLLAFLCVATSAAFFAFSARRAAPVAPFVAPQPEILDATIVERSWTTTLAVSRRRLVDGEGFAEQQPSDALDVQPAGRRHHHDEQVPDGTTVETYFEDVPYQDTETYTEQVRCGEDCTETPPTCTEQCTDDGNGFATCTPVCSGGGRSCVPRMCTETRTRPVTRTRQESRTRTVPRFRAEPRDAPWFRWRAWAWVPDRRIERTGTSEAPAWPEESEIPPGAPLGEGEEERIDRSWVAGARARDTRGREHVLPVRELEDLARYPLGGTVRLEVSPYGTLLREIPP